MRFPTLLALSHLAAAGRLQERSHLAALQRHMNQDAPVAVAAPGQANNGQPRITIEPGSGKATAVEVSPTDKSSPGILGETLAVGAGGMAAVGSLVKDVADGAVDLATGVGTETVKIADDVVTGVKDEIATDVARTKNETVNEFRSVEDRARAQNTANSASSVPKTEMELQAADATVHLLEVGQTLYVEVRSASVVAASQRAKTPFHKRKPSIRRVPVN